MHLFERQKWGWKYSAKSYPSFSFHLRRTTDFFPIEWCLFSIDLRQTQHSRAPSLSPAFAPQPWAAGQSLCPGSCPVFRMGQQERETAIIAWNPLSIPGFGSEGEILVSVTHVWTGAHSVALLAMSCRSQQGNSLPGSPFQSHAVQRHQWDAQGGLFLLQLQVAVFVWHHLSWEVCQGLPPSITQSSTGTSDGHKCGHTVWLPSPFL